MIFLEIILLISSLRYFREIFRMFADTYSKLIYLKNVYMSYTSLSVKEINVILFFRKPKRISLSCLPIIVLN